MNIAVILSGGIGSRMGLDVPKQYVKVNGVPIICYCLKTFLENDNTDIVIIAVADEWKEFVRENVPSLHPSKPILYVQSGETRQYSIFNAMRAIKNEGFAYDDVVLIHDAARPLVSHDLISRCYDGCNDADGVLPVVPVKDTVYYSNDGKNIQTLLNRSHLWAGQAPEAFRFGNYLHAHESLEREELLKINGSTELAFKAGLVCQMIEGDVMNFKITTPEDLSNFESIIGKI